MAADTAQQDLEALAARGESLSGRRLRGAALEGARLSGARLAGADLRRARLAGADLSGARLDGADLRKADLSGANLAGASLVAAALQGARLAGARLTGANAATANLFGADLAGADLSGATLSYANLEAAVLADADLTGCALTGAYAPRARLTGARLEAADLSSGDFFGARWEGAVLERCAFEGAVLRGARGLPEDVERRAAASGARVGRHPVRWFRRRSRPVQALVLLVLLAAAALPVWWVLDPVNRPVRDVLDDARIDVAEGRPDQAARRLDRKLRRPMLSEQERRDLARSLVDVYSRMGRLEEAARVHEAMARARPKDDASVVEAELGLAAIDSQRGDQAAALRRIRALAERFDSGDALSRSVHERLTNALLNDYKPAEAEAAARRLIAWAGQDVPARKGYEQMRARALSALGRVDEAAAIFEDLARYYAKDPGRLQGVLWDWAGAYRTAGRAREAIGVYERIAEAFSGRPEIVTEARRQIVMARMESDPAAAMQALRALAEANGDLSRPEARSVHMDLAARLSQAGDFAAARAVYEKVAEAAPPADASAAEAFRMAAEMLEREGRDAEAAERLRRGVATYAFPPESRARMALSLSRVLERTEGVEAALAVLRAVVEDAALSTGVRRMAAFEAARLLRAAGRAEEADAIEPPPEPPAIPRQP